MMRSFVYVVACLSLGITVSAIPLKAAPLKSIEWTVTNVPSEIAPCMAVLLQGPTAFNPRPDDYLPYVYREYPGAPLSLDFDGQVDGISFLYLTRVDIVRHPVVQRIIQAYEEAEERASAQP